MPQTFRVYTFLAPALLPLYEAITGHLAQRLQCTMELHVGQTYADLTDADFSFICGLPYVLRTAPRHTPLLHALAAPVLTGERYENRPIYFSDVIVHRDSPYQSFADLRGCTWAYNEPESQSGYGITRYHLVQLGETNGYFGQVINVGFHQRALRLVAKRKLDAAAIDSHVLAVERRDHPELVEQLRVMDSFGPSTIQPFAASSAVSEPLRQDVQGILAALHEDEPLAAMLSKHFISRLVPVNDSDYDDIRAMLAACERADFLTLR